MMGLLSFLLAYLGMNCLCCAMSRHALQVSGKTLRPAAQILLRLLGTLLLLFSLMSLIDVYGYSIGCVIWFGVLMLMASTVALLLSYKIRWLMYSGPGWIMRRWH